MAYSDWIGSPRMQIPFLGNSALIARSIAVYATALLLLFHGLRRPRCANDIADLAIGGLFLAWLFSSSLKEVPLPLLVGAFFFAHKLLSEDDAKILYFACLLLIGLQMVLSLWAYLADFHQLHSPGIGERASGLFETPNAVYPLALISAWLFLSTAQTTRRRMIRLLCYGMAALSTMVLTLTFSRAGYLGMAAALSYFALQNKWRAQLISITAALVFVGASFSVRGNHGTLDRSAIGHWLSVQEGFRVLPPLLLTGGGPHAFVDSQGYKALLTRSSFAPWEPKMLLLNVALCYGVIGSVLLCVWFVVTYRRMNSVHLKAAIIAIACASAMDSPILSNLMTMPSTLALALVSSKYIPDHSND